MTLTASLGADDDIDIRVVMCGGRTRTLAPAPVEVVACAGLHPPRAPTEVNVRYRLLDSFSKLWNPKVGYKPLVEDCETRRSVCCIDGCDACRRRMSTRTQGSDITMHYSMIKDKLQLYFTIY
jgi:hypothetical protein